MSNSTEDPVRQPAGGTAGKAAPAHPWLVDYPASVDWHQALSPGRVDRLLETAVERYGARPFANFLGRQTSYAELDAHVRAVAAGLQGAGVRKGTRVGLFLPNSPTFVIYYFAVLRAGGTVVNYNPLYTVEELAFQVRDSGTELMVTLDLDVLFKKVEGLLREGTLDRALVCSFPALLPAAKAVLYRLMKSKDLAKPASSPVAARVLLERTMLTAGASFTPVPIDPLEDVAVLQYTGGTTGTPKAAMLTHANVYINSQQVAAWATTLVKGEERVFAVLPFFHVFAMTAVMLHAVEGGAELIMMPRFALDDAIKLIGETKPTVLPGVPTLFTALLNHPNLSKLDLTGLKFCLSGGAPLPGEVKQRFEALTRCRVVEGYGLTETSPVVSCNPLDGDDRPGTIGLPLPGTCLSLRDLDDPTKEVAIGERGEICVKGPQVMKGYWGRPEETAEQFVDDYLRTGDVGIMSADGYVTIVDRIKDLIIASGFNVYPRVVEEAIYTHPAVAEVTVIGIKDDYRGEAPKAFVKLKSGMSATAEDILAHLQPKLSRIEMPAEIAFRDELPKTLIGKLSKKELKAEEEGARAGG